MNFNSRLDAFHQRYGLLLLLWLGLLLKGGKTPATFFVWTVFALAFIAFRLPIWARGVSLSGYRSELALGFCLALSQIFSKDPSVTFYYTTQAFLLLLLWISVKADPQTLPDTKTLMMHWTAMGFAALAVTAYQVLHGLWRSLYGPFPVNPVFNAAWMACIGTALVAYLLNEKPSLIKHRNFMWATAILFVAVCGALPARSSVVALVFGLLYAGRSLFSVRRVLLFLGILAALALVLPSRIVTKRLRLNEGNYRNSLWSVALQGIADHPFVGRGLGNFEMTYQRHSFPVETDPVRYARTTSFAHNEFLQLAADAGIPALLIVGAAFLSLFKSKLSEDLCRRRVAVSVLIVLAVLASYNILWHLPIFIFLTLLWCRILLSPDVSVPHSSSARGSGFYYAIALMMIGFSAGWYAVRDGLDQRGRWDILLRYQPYDASAWESWANHQNDVGRSLQGYARAAALVPEQPYFHEALGRALEATHQRENDQPALMEYERALDYAPFRAFDALAAGRVLFLLGDPKEALEWFKKALRMEPHYWECDLWIARCLVSLGKPQQAIGMLKELMNRHQAYLDWRDRTETDLPSPNWPAPYDQAILAYDENVVKRELSLIDPRP